MKCYNPLCKKELDAFSLCSNCAGEKINKNFELQQRIKELEEGLKSLKKRLEFLNSDEAKHFSKDNISWIILADELLSKQGGKE